MKVLTCASRDALPRGHKRAKKNLTKLPKNQTTVPPITTHNRTLPTTISSSPLHSSHNGSPQRFQAQRYFTINPPPLPPFPNHFLQPLPPSLPRRRNPRRRPPPPPNPPPPNPLHQRRRLSQSPPLPVLGRARAKPLQTSTRTRRSPATRVKMVAGTSSLRRMPRERRRARPPRLPRRP
jgi:hypothetical protein